MARASTFRNYVWETFPDGSQLKAATQTSYESVHVDLIRDGVNICRIVKEEKRTLWYRTGKCSVNVHSVSGTCFHIGK